MEAANLYQKDLEQFKARAKSCVTDCKEQLFLTKDHPDPHYLTFSTFQEQIHGPVRDKMKRGADGHNRERQEEGGERKSYVATGSLSIFSDKLLTPSNEGPKSLPK